jgi:DNA-binding NarL/FixJ family response regulator
MKKIKVLLADDHTLVRNGIRSLLENLPDIEIVGEAEDGAEALLKTKDLAPDVLMVDIAMPIMNGIEVVAEVNRNSKETRTLILSMHHNEDYILKSVEAGAHGYLLKDTTRDEMLRALRAVAAGEKYFSPSVSNIIISSYIDKVKGSEKIKAPKTKISKKEKPILKYLIGGLSSREIAEKLELSTRTVENHRGNMMKKLGVKNAVELVKKALEEKLV